MGTINNETLLAEISSDLPCGENLEHDPAFVQLARDIQGKPEHYDGKTTQQAEPPNWYEIRDRSLDLLCRTRDLRILVFLSRALLHIDGLVGLKNGLALILQSLQQHWGTIYPLLDADDGGDPTERLNSLIALCDLDSMIRPLNRVVLVKSKVLGEFSVRDVHLATGKLSAPADHEQVPDMAVIEAAVKDCEPADLKLNHDAAGAALGCLDEIENLLTERVGGANAPNFLPLSETLIETKQLLARWLNQLGVSEPDRSEGSETGELNSGISERKTSAIHSSISCSRDVIQALERICDYYQCNEPSSPIPILLSRAKRLVSKDFMEIMRDLAPDGVSQVEVFRGLEESDS